MREQLSIIITADNKQAVAALKQTVTGLDGVAVASKKSGDAMKSSQTNYLNFGRVIQDLPYGINGISNNLTQLIPSVGALGLAFSAAVTALTFAQIGFGAWTRGLTEGSKAADELKDKVDGFNESAAKEIIKFKQLTEVAANANIPLNQRLQAVGELQSQYPAYLGNLSKEDILSGQIGNSYDKIVSALKAKIALQSAEERLIPIIKEQLVVSDKLADAQKTVGAAAGLTAEDFKRSTLNGRDFAKELQAAAIGAAKTIQIQSREYDALEAKIQRVFSSMSALSAASNGLNLKATKTVEEKTFSTFEGTLKPVDSSGVNSLTKKGTGFVETERQLNELMTQRNELFIQQNEQIFANINAMELLNMQQQFANQLSEIGASLFTSMGNALLYGQDMGEAFTNTLKKLVMDLAAAVAQALIFKGIMAALSGGTSVISGGSGIASAFNGMQVPSSGGAGIFGQLFGMISGNNILLSNSRTGTAMGFRRGRR